MNSKEPSQKAFIQKVYFEKIKDLITQTKAVNAYNNKKELDEYLEKEGVFHLVREMIPVDKRVSFKKKDEKNALIIKLRALQSNAQEEKSLLKVEVDEYKDQKVRVFQAMTNELITVIDSTTIGNCIGLINKYNITCLPVINPVNKSLIGLITIKDIINHLLDKENIKKFITFDGFSFVNENNFIFFEEEVKNYMKKELITVGPEEEVETACNIMLENRIHRVLVVREKQILGIFSAIDVLKLISKFGIVKNVL